MLQEALGQPLFLRPAPQVQWLHRKQPQDAEELAGAVEVAVLVVVRMCLNRLQQGVMVVVGAKAATVRLKS